jgi:hypothetical protein
MTFAPKSVDEVRAFLKVLNTREKDMGKRIFFDIVIAGLYDDEIVKIYLDIVREQKARVKKG